MRSFFQEEDNNTIIEQKLLKSSEQEINIQNLNIFYILALIDLVGCIITLCIDLPEYCLFDLTVFSIYIVLFSIVIFSLKWIEKSSPWFKYLLISALILLVLGHSIFTPGYMWMAFAIPIIMSSRYYSKALVKIVSALTILALSVSSIGVVFLQPSFGYVNASAVFLPKGISVVGDGIHNMNELLAGMLNNGTLKRSEYFFRLWRDYYIFYVLIIVCVSFICYLITIQEVRVLKRQSEMLEEKRMHEVEMTESKNRIMVSQIGPHFIFNVLNSVYELCEEDVSSAQEMIEAFSNYLRYDIKMLTKEGTVPFKEEMDSVMNYLKLEKMRFGNRLNYVIDTEEMDFSVPPFSIEPLVENAVKHGICRKKEGGTITITTRKLDDQILIQIKDDGVGFDPSKLQLDGESHIGIYNVKTRLENQVNGKLEIESTPGVGSCISIWCQFKKK